MTKSERCENLRRQEHGKKFKVLKGSMIQRALGVLAFLVIFPPAVASAGMEVLSDGQLEGLTGQRFSRFTLVDGVARAEFDIKVRTWTEIDSLKLGYYHDGTSLGWDQDWTAVKIGSPTEDLVVNGIYMKAVFENITDPAARSLKSIEFGTGDRSGFIAATFTSFSGEIVSGSPIKGHRLHKPFSTINFTNTAFYISLDVDGPHKGFWVHWDKATTTN